MEESSEVIEEVVIRNEECPEQVLLAPGKTKFDAEKLAIELLASRLDSAACHLLHVKAVKLVEFYFGWCCLLFLLKRYYLRI